MPNPVGRPPLYKTVEGLQNIIDQYFDWCDARIQHVYDKKSGSVIEVISPAPYTMVGLARRIGMSRQALSEYAASDKFGDTIKGARDRVQEDVEIRLMETAATGAIFNLKNNFGYKDVSSKEHSGPNGEPIETNASITYMPKQLPDDYFRDNGNNPSQ